MDPPRNSLTLLDLPNEIFLHILHPLPSPSLLALSSTNHRLHNLIIRIFYVRLKLAATLPGRSLVFECYPPSRKLYESHMLGAYLGTPGLEELHPDEDNPSPIAQLSKIRNLYSRYRPYRQIRERRVQWKHPAGDIPGSRTYGGAQYYGNNSTVRTFSPAAAYYNTVSGTPPSAGYDTFAVAGTIGSGSLTQAAQQMQPRDISGSSSSSQQASTTQPQQASWPQETQQSFWAPPWRQQPQQQQEGQQEQQDDLPPPDTSAAQTTPTPSRPQTSSPPPSTAAPAFQNEQSSPPPPDPITQIINLDPSENLQQLCLNVSISIPAHKAGIFYGFQDVLKDGVLRVWREWLGRAHRGREEREGSDGGLPAPLEAVYGDGNGDNMCKGKGKVKATATASKAQEEAYARHPKNDPHILWVGRDDCVGVKFSVRRLRWNRHTPVLISAEDLVREEEEGPVSFEVVYEELLIRTRDLLLACERLDEQVVSDSGKAMVFAHVYSSA